MKTEFTFGGSVTGAADSVASIAPPAVLRPTLGSLAWQRWKPAAVAVSISLSAASAAGAGEFRVVAGEAVLGTVPVDFTAGESVESRVPVDLSGVEGQTPITWQFDTTSAGDSGLEVRVSALLTVEVPEAPGGC